MKTALLALLFTIAKGLPLTVDPVEALRLISVAARKALEGARKSAQTAFEQTHLITTLPNFTVPDFSLNLPDGITDLDFSGQSTSSPNTTDTVLIAYKFPYSSSGNEEDFVLGILDDASKLNISVAVAEHLRRDLASDNKPSTTTTTTTMGLSQNLVAKAQGFLSGLGFSTDEIVVDHSSQPTLATSNLVLEAGKLQRELVLLRMFAELSQLGDTNRRGRELSEVSESNLSTNALYSSQYLPHLQMEAMTIKHKTVLPAIRALLDKDERVSGIFDDEIIKVDSAPNSVGTELLSDAATTARNVRDQQTEGVGSSQRKLLGSLVTPNDRFFNRQWSLMASGAGAARVQGAWSVWDGAQSDSTTIVALIDSGINLNHVDLQGRIWHNEDEICNNGIDDDENGYIDDCEGWDFVHDNASPQDELGHGTSSAGIIAAIPNNGMGIAPICWNCKLMNLRALDKNNVGPTSGFIKVRGVGSSVQGLCSVVIQAIDYALGKGVKLANNSWGKSFSSDNALKEAVRRTQSAGMIFVAAAGNLAIDNDQPDEAMVPASWPFDNVISVAAVEPNGQLASFSNYGKKTVHLAAPGTNVLAPVMDQGYQFVSGTSFSTPHVTGVAALLLSMLPKTTSYKDIIELIVQNTRPVSSLEGRLITNGVLDAEAVLKAAENFLLTKKTTKTNQVRAMAETTKPQSCKINCPKISRCISIGSISDCRCPEGSAWDGIDGGSCRKIVLPELGRCKDNGGCGVNSLCQISRGILGISRSQCVCLNGYVLQENICVVKGVPLDQGAENLYYQNDTSVITASFDGKFYQLLGGSPRLLFHYKRKSCGDLFDEDRCGRILGFDFWTEYEVVACAGFPGLVLINWDTGAIQTLHKNVTFCNGVAVAKTDTFYGVFFTDSTIDWPRQKFLYSVLDGRSRGRLLFYDFHTKKTSIILDELAFPNGIKWQDDSLILSETFKAGVSRVRFEGHVPKVEQLAKLPFLTDNIQLINKKIIVTGGPWRTWLNDWLMKKAKPLRKAAAAFLPPNLLAKLFFRAQESFVGILAETGELELIYTVPMAHASDSVVHGSKIILGSYNQMQPVTVFEGSGVTVQKPGK